MIEWSNPWSETTTCFGRLGDYSGGVHLFPFRTEKLSPLTPMVLQVIVGE